MSLKSYIVAMTISLMLWVAAYYAMVASYHLAQHAGLISDVIIKAAFVTLIG